MSRALLFSGQGSQYVGMAKDLVDNYESAKKLFNEADSILGYSLSAMCFDGPVETLRETRYTQPALFVHEAALLSVLSQQLECTSVAGHSLGEFSALYHASVLSFEDALKLVSLRGQLMFEIGRSQPGTMAAVVGLSDEKVEEVCASIRGGVVVPANYNSPGQVVVSGDAESVRNSMAVFKQAGARMVTELQVSGAFHSPLMTAAQESLSVAIHTTTFHEASKEVYCNVDAAKHRESASLQANLVSQLVSPVRWTQILLNMKQNGVTEYVEIGPGKVLQGLVKRTLSDVVIRGFDTAKDVEKLQTIV